VNSQGFFENRTNFQRAEWVKAVKGGKVASTTVSKPGNSSYTLQDRTRGSSQWKEHWGWFMPDKATEEGGKEGVNWEGDGKEFGFRRRKFQPNLNVGGNRKRNDGGNDGHPGSGLGALRTVGQGHIPNPNKR